jgi:FkbM family methyltransferase
VRTSTSLEQNLEDNGPTNVTVIRSAVSDEAPTHTLYLSGTASHSGLAPQDDVVGTKSVESVRIDDVVPRKPVGVIKMDIEGYEPAALRGIEQTLALSPEVQLFLEFAPERLTAVGVDPR